MKVLVTGANGLIGAVTVSYLLERGYEVRAVDLTEETKLNDVEYAACDIRDYNAVRKQVRGYDAVYLIPLLGSVDILSAGNTKRQPNSLPSFGYFFLKHGVCE